MSWTSHSRRAWKNADAVYLSFDIDVFDPGCAPGTGTPDAGGMSSREGLQAARRAALEGLIGMDLVRIAPPYDHADITSLLGARAVMDVLATLVEHGHLGDRLTGQDRAAAEFADVVKSGRMRPPATASPA